MTLYTNDTRKFTLRTLTPVHIGSGTVLSANVDIIRGSEESLIIDVDAALSALPPEALLSFDAPLRLRETLVRFGLDLEDYVLYSYPGDFDATTFRLALRDGRGSPLIPGSSLKGAIRTALLCARSGTQADMVRTTQGLKSRRDRDLGSLPPHAGDGRRKLPKPQKAASAVEKNVFRPSQDDAKFDVLKSLHVLDAAFAEDTLAATLVEISSPKPGQPDRTTDFKIGVEVVCEDAAAEVELRLDQYLLGPAGKLLGFDRFGLSWDGLAKACRSHTLKLIDGELAHFEGLSPAWSKTAATLGKLRKTVADSASTGAIPLRLGWGIGWTGTTGGVLPEPDRLDLLDAFTDLQGKCVIAKYGSSYYQKNGQTFPKSRRLEKGSGFPLGFIVLEPEGIRRA